jgi:ATP-dependent DNA ligase
MLAKELSTGVQRAQPCFIEPMQVTPARVLPDGSAWTYEAKFDGYRCLAARRSSGVVLWSRRERRHRALPADRPSLREAAA